ncbi:MAG TPA: type II CAAX endopeptidase family protein [Patescibacteria group bacterium]|nr:type II CAAX endopeptidase family protein [Patescibacteria group bacterium]
MSKDTSSLRPDPAAPPSKDGARWEPLTAIALTPLSFVVGEFIAAAVVGLFPHLLGWPTDQANAWLSSTAGQFVFVVLAEGLVLLIARSFIRWRKGTLADVGIYRKPQLYDAAVGIIAFAIYFVAVTLVLNWASSQLHVNIGQKQELGFDIVTGTTAKVMAFVSLVLLPPLVEEIMFRGFLFGSLRKKLPFAATTLLVSVIFASLHLLEGEGSGLLWVAGIDTFVLSLILCYVREKTGNIWAGMAVHMLKNGMAFLYLYVLVLH